MSDLFSVRRLSLTYPRQSTPALYPMSFTIPSGSLVVVAGASGSGKTTLINLLGLLWDQGFCGQIRYMPAQPNVGGSRFRLAEWDYASCGAAHRDELRNRHFGFALQSSYLLKHLNCRENAAMPLAVCGMPKAERLNRVDRLLRRVDRDRQNSLADAARKPARECSGGQRQRVAVIRAIVHDPQVVFADEPLSNLDSFSAEAVLELLGEWLTGDLASTLGDGDDNAVAGRRTLIIVSHNPHQLWKWGTEMHEAFPLRFALLRRGRLVGDRLLEAGEIGSPDRVLELIDPERDEIA